LAAGALCSVLSGRRAWHVGVLWQTGGKAAHSAVDALLTMSKASTVIGP